MILGITNFNNNNSIAFGNKKFASDDFKQIAKTSARIYDRILKSKKGSGVTLSIGCNSEYKKYCPSGSSIKFSKKFSDGIIAQLSVHNERIQKPHFIKFKTINSKTNEILTNMHFSITRNGKVEEADRYIDLITPEGNEAFEKYGSRLIRPFLNLSGE